jgi:glycosyltransferase involved in cell wall biosynthesis
MGIKVSIIVPIYKVERYIRRCIDSILNQTYPLIEVILVNDGSPDNCGQIIDEYAKVDCRIKVLHKQNGGLSDARNKGIELVTGEYVVFVDSDDWLADNFLEQMLNHSFKFNADVVQAAFYYAYDDHLLFDNRYYSKNDLPTILDNKTLMHELIVNEKVKNFAWGKLYRTEIIKDILFVKGVLFEDVFWAHRVMARVNTYVIIHQPLCFYLQRSESIVSTYTPKNLDILKGLIERHSFIEQYYSNLISESFRVILKTSLQHYKLLSWKNDVDQHCLYRIEIQDYIKTNHLKLKAAVKGNKLLNNQLNLFVINPYVYLCFDLLLKVLRKISLLKSPPSLERININSINKI